MYITNPLIFHFLPIYITVAPAFSNHPLIVLGSRSWMSANSMFAPLSCNVVLIGRKSGFFLASDVTIAFAVSASICHRLRMPTQQRQERRLPFAAPRCDVGRVGQRK